ncbi:ketopantoate reductase PanE/ApbA-domain-containing protein [Aspergillus unguis]
MAEVNVLLYGLGAIGSFYAFILKKSARVKLTVVARSNYTAVAENGIQITSKRHGQHTFRPDHVVRTPAEAAGTQFDYIVCAHKAIDPAGAVVPLDPVVSDSSTVVVLQNGVGNEDPFRERFPSATIISGVVWVGAYQASPGVTVHTGAENTEIGLFSNPSGDSGLEKKRLDMFTSLLEAGGTFVSTHENIQPCRWEKVVWNVAWNAITTLTDQDVAAWLNSSDQAESYTKSLMEEVIAVAASLDVHLKAGLPDALIARVKTLGDIRTSMQGDREAGRKMEIEVILGVPVKKGKEKGVPTPRLESLYVLLLAINKRLG